MPAYHSVFLQDGDVRTIGNTAILPLRTRTRGPAYTLPALPAGAPLDVDPSSESYDPADEVLQLFRANTFFRNFEIQGPADRLLIYGILFTQECVAKVKPNLDKREAEKDGYERRKKLRTQRARWVGSLNYYKFAIPGDANFPLKQAFEAPRDRQDAEQLRQYLSQFRQEIAMRLLQRLYEHGPTPSKWWLSFSKRKFMGRSL